MGAGEPDDERVARNESAFRKVNEAIEAGRGLTLADHPVHFVCECARLGCTALVELTPAEYEAIRAHPRRFVVVDGHVADGEVVVERRPGHLVVEKRGDSGAAAAERDPRT